MLDPRNSSRHTPHPGHIGIVVNWVGIALWRKDLQCHRQRKTVRAPTLSQIDNALTTSPEFLQQPKMSRPTMSLFTEDVLIELTQLRALTAIAGIILRHRRRRICKITGLKQSFCFLIDFR